MPRTFVHTLRCLSCLCVVATAAQAQSDTITANPNAVKLRHIWFKRGEYNENYALWHGSLGDVNRDSFMDFAVYSNMKGYVQVFLGDTAGPSTTPYRTYEHRYISSPPAVGDFWGTGYKAFVLQQAEGTWTRYVHVHRTDPGISIDSPAVSWKTDPSDTLATYMYLEHAAAADLDRDGDDELLLFAADTYDGTASRYPEVWIYAGGPDFHMDSPAVILRDPRLNTDMNPTYWGAVADLDGDGHPDILVGARYADAPAGNAVQVIWGRGGIPDPDEPFQHFVYGTTRVLLADADGDGVPDVLHGRYLFLSSKGQDARSRTYDSAGAEVVFLGGRVFTARAVGHLNDSLRRFSMTGLTVPSGLGYGDETVLGFSGTPSGPDQQYEATYSTGADGLTQGDIFGRVAPGGSIGDVDGDGWDDALFGSWQYPFEEGRDGAAVVLAGGPYIPRDSLPPSAIRDLSLEQKWNAVSVWPLPASDHVNIAWRGDLMRAPRRFEVHDAAGRRVAGGEVPAGTRAALWRCAGAAAGVYLLSLYDRNHSFLTSTRILIE
jgi:hypothetical protein